MTREEIELYNRSQYIRCGGGLGNGCGPTLLGGLLLLLVLLLASCTTTKYVPVETVRTEIVNKTDTFIQKDTVQNEKETILREARPEDSVMIAKLGIQLKDNERLLILMQRELEKEKSKTYESKTDSFIRVDSVQVPYPVERQLNKWESFCLEYGKVTTGMSIALVLLGILWLIWLIKRKL